MPNLSPKMLLQLRLLLTAATLIAAITSTTSTRECPPCGTTRVPYPLSTSPTCGDQDYTIQCNNNTNTLLFPTSNNTYTITSITPQNQRLVIEPSPFLPNTCVTSDISTQGVQLNQTAPFNVTGDNTIMFLNCSRTLLRSPLNCSSNSLCHVYINSTRDASACATTPICCTFQAGGGATSYSIRVREGGCQGYRSFVGLDPNRPVGQWGRPGLMIQWRLPQEPVCGTQADCTVDEGNSTCRADPNSVGISRCFCNSGLHWDGINGICAHNNVCEDEGGCDNSNKAALIAGSIVFDGSNFMSWSKSIKIALGAKNKLGFLEGKHSKPATGSEEIQKWIRCDYMVRSWILATMKPDIAGSLVNMDSTKQMWEEILERYAQTNAPQLFQLKKDLWELQQNNMSISEYYCKLKGIWDQIMDLEGIPECSCGAMKKCTCELAKKVMDLQAQERLIKFVMGLNSGYDQMKTNLISSDPLLPVNRAYNLMLQVERQKQLTGEITAGLEASALAATKRFQPKSLGPLQHFQKKDYYKKFKEEKMGRICEHCGKKGHLKVECFQIVGYPEWYKKPDEHYKHAGNAMRNAEDEMEDNPLNYNSNGKEASVTKLDNTFVNNIVQEVLKAMNEKQAGTSSQANFAGKLSISNAVVKKTLKKSHNWLIDSGASDHMTGNLDLLVNINKLKGKIKVGLPDGSEKYVTEIGDVILNNMITLKNVFYVQDFHHNLLSVAKLLKEGDLKLLFDKNGCVLQGLSIEKAILFGTKEQDLYKLVKKEEAEKNDDLYASKFLKSCNSVVNLNTIHARLGHVSLSKMQHLVFCKCENLKYFFCDTCSISKHHRLPFTLSKSIASNCFDLIHVDLWGPYRTKALSGASYFLTIVDDHSRVTWTQLLSNKEQVKGTLLSFINHVENHFNTRVKTLRSDNGTEVFQEECKMMFAEKGIFHQRSVAGVPQQNARVERKHRFLLETARALKLHAGMPNYLWGECILAATHLINLLPTAVLKWDTPYKRLMKKEPNYEHLRMIGCLCYASPSHKSSDKFAPRGIRCIMLGYPYCQKGYKVMDLATRKVFVSRDVVFKENIFPFLLKKNASGNNIHNDRCSTDESENCDMQYDELTHILHEVNRQEEDEINVAGTGEEEINEETEANTEEMTTLHQPVTRKSSRESEIPARFKDFIYAIPGKGSTAGNASAHTETMKNLEASGLFSTDYLCSLNNVLRVREPLHYNEAVRDEGWVQAMQEELDALDKNNTWEMTTLPAGKSVIDSKWVYKIKFQPDGSIDRLKARLVARGDKQVEGKDYKHTFSPVPKFTSVRTLIALAASQQWHLHHLDINNAFLHGYLDEEVYMRPPKGYKHATGDSVCKLKKSLYGLKQASRQWNIELTKFLIEHGYEQSKKDYSLFTKRLQRTQVIILVYVDDLLVTGNDLTEISQIKMALDSAFTIKDLGNMKYFLGIEVARNEQGIMLNQRKFILDILKSTGTETCKPCKCPFPKGLKLSTDQGELLQDPEFYRSIIGKLLYLNLTRPDISYSVQQLSQFMTQPRQPHLQAAIHVIKYLAGTINVGLFYSAQSELKLQAFCDSDWGNCAFSARSLTGYCVFLDKSLISWKTKKQKTVSKSSTEAEYRCMSQTTSEIVWLDGILNDLGFQIPTPIDLHCDNKSAIYLANNPIFHERTKHLKVDCHYVRDHLTSGFLNVLHVRSFLQLADLMTKCLSEQQHNFLSSKLGLFTISPT